MKAVTIRVNDVEGVGGFVLPGDRVDVVLTRQIDKGAATTEVVLQNARVLAVDQIADERAAKATVAKSVTLEVDTVAAQKVWLAVVGRQPVAAAAQGGRNRRSEDAQDHAQGFGQRRTGQQRQGRDRDRGGDARSRRSRNTPCRSKAVVGTYDDRCRMRAPGKSGRGVNQGRGSVS